MTVKVRDYRPDDSRDDALLADMFNDFDSAWPGGFTRGTPETAESVRERLQRMRRLAILVAEDMESGDLVGFCDLDAQPGQKERSYVGLLGARLSVHGKGVGKALIREAVRRATEAGYRETTLHTWAGNTKAVPLYKKTGFNWVPDTDVYMRNFIPSALATPIVRTFLAGRDWYALHERDLTVAPDDVTWKGMKVYPYRFRSGEDFVQLVYQADSAGLTAVETPDFSVSCTVPVEDAAVGQTYPIVWEIEPRRGKSIEVVLLAEADAGLNVAVQERCVISALTRIERNLAVSSTATPRRVGERTHLVRSTILLDGQPLTLETGVKVVRPIEVQYAGQGVLMGREEKITVNLRNRLPTAVAGTLAFDASPALECPQPVQTFRLPAKSWSQCEFHVTALEPGSHPTRLRYEADAQSSDLGPESSKAENSKTVTGGKSIAFRAFAGAEVLASIDIEDDEKAFLEAADVRVEVDLRGGHMEVFLNGNRHCIAQTSATIGPPFGSARMRPPLCSARIEPCASGAKLCIVTPSCQFPELTLERVFSFAAGGVLKVEQRVVNTSGRALPAQLRLRTGSHQNCALAFVGQDGLIREPLQSRGEYPGGDTDILGTGARLAENWLALEGEGDVLGLIWQGAPAQDMEWTHVPNLTYDLGDIPPHAFRAVPPLWLVTTPGDWQTVRRWWARLVQPSGVREAEKLEPGRVLSLGAEPSPILLRQSRENTTLALHSHRGNAITGTMSLIGNTFRVEPSAFDVDKVNRDRPLRTEVAIEAPNAQCADFLKAAIDAGPLTELSEVPVARLAVGDRMEVARPEPGAVVIDNGYFTLRFATGFFGALTSLETAGVNHLFSAWPEAKPFMWMNPWFGGVHAFNSWMGDLELAREAFTGELVERTGERGWLWQGVRMACDLAHKDRTWLRVELEYLALPGSNAIALLLRRTNRTDARMPIHGGVVAWAQPGGTRANSTLHWERNGEARRRRRGGFAAEGESGRWAAVENPDTKDALILIATDPADSAAWEDFGQEGPHLQARGHVDLGPHETQERLFWLVHTTDISQAGAYAAALSMARRLP